MTKYFLPALLLLGSAALARGPGKLAPDPLPGVKAKLTISVEEYDPFKPSKGVVKCVVVNQSKDPVEIATGYDGRTHLLKGHGKGHSHEVTLYPGRTAKLIGRQVVVKPGEEAVVFELSLDEVLYQGIKGNPRQVRDLAWRWDWIARPESPNSPIHRYRAEGFLESASFWAIVAAGGKKLTTDKVTLKVKPSDPNAK